MFIEALFTIASKRLLLTHEKMLGILGLQKRRIQSGAKDKAWSLRAFVQQSFIKV